MNIFKNIINKFSAVLVSFAVFWIVTGSTIEFHEKYVYHKFVNLWQAQIAQAGKDFKKSIRFIGKNNQGFNGGNALTSENANIARDVNLNLSEGKIFARCLVDLLTPEYIYDGLLRAPPVA